ncbi:hypothetical protein FOZ61_000941 [Perkinsus olseni]|uniref:RAP domain-containing protein n=1 Tax=Perkinsus olseni TaxID=32597 RepID=A0A7J6MGK0_PEROL|nr:hypothetical protein FOL46_006551 [Perkinsus olseni]KAF4670280.1 hypothetical protein FOZ61_000941 [Perkinsus olseni]
MSERRLSIALPRLLDRISRASRRELILLGTEAEGLKFKDWHPMHFTAALQRLAKVAERSDLPFVRCLVRTALDRGKLHLYQPDQLGMLLWSVGKLSKNAVDRGTLSHLLVLVEGNALSMSPQALSSALYTLAKYQERFSSEEVARVMETALGCLMDLDGFSAQSVANIMWAYGKVGYRITHSALSSVGRHIEVNALDYESRHISNVLWALAALECPDGSRAIFNTVCSSWLSVPALRTTLSSQGLANVLWAFGKTPSDWLDSSFLETVVRLGADLSARFPEVEPRAIANCLWGVGIWAARDHTLARLYARLLNALAPVLRPQIPTMDPTTTVALCWCYAKEEDRLLRELARAAIERVPELSAKDYPTLFWSAIGVLSREEVGVLCDWLERRSPCCAAQVSKCLWALVDARYYDDALVARLVKTVKLDRALTPKQYASIVWAWSQLSPALSAVDSTDALFVYLGTIIPLCGIEELAQLAGSFAVLRRCDLATECLRAIPGEMLQTLSEAGASQVAQARASCAVYAGQAIPDGITWPSPTPSHFQLQVYEALRALPRNVNVKQEFETVVGPVDALVSSCDGRRVVVEADGPSHFLRSARGRDTRRLNGRTLWKGETVGRLLSAKVVRVSIADFSKHYITGGREEAHRYVRHLVEDAFL